jgi:type IV pilus assembly protein PilC
MTSFHYKALGQDGRLSKGSLYASNPLDLEARLARMNLELISFSQQTSKVLHSRRTISTQDLAMFCYQLEQLHSAGVPLLEALQDLCDSTHNSQLKKILLDMCAEIEGGKTLSQALATHDSTFDAVFINLIAAGEYAGKLDMVLTHLYQTLHWQKELATQSKRLLAYPIFLAFVMLFTILFLMTYLVPQLVAFLTVLGQELPLNTRILIAVSRYLMNYWWLLLSLALFICTLFIYGLRKISTFRQYFDSIKLRLPLVGGILRKIILARYTRYFALMYQAGIPILQALKISETIVGNHAVAAALQSAQQQINAGSTIHQSFSDLAFFPTPVLRMIKVGENTGNLDKTLVNISQFYDSEVRAEIAQLLAMLEPLLTIVLGSVLAFIIVSVLGPIYASFASLGL